MGNIQRTILDAASPAEIKSGGKGWIVTAGFSESPFGACLIGECSRGICHLSFIESADGAAEMDVLQSEWPQAQLHRDDANAARMAALIFKLTHKDDMQDFRVHVRGTPFQQQVWRALLQVPQGSLTSYGQLAATIGRPTAARAVGTAVGQNPISILIPCHRVIRQTGAIGGYRWGLERKRALIEWEGASLTAQDKSKHNGENDDE